MAYPQYDSQGFGARTIHPAYSGSGNGTPLLDRFYFMFSGRTFWGNPVDHHIQQVMVQPDGQYTDLAPGDLPGFSNNNPIGHKVMLSYQDEGGNDEYFHNVGHTFVPGLSRFRVRDVASGRSFRNLPAPPAPQMVFALVGFQITYRGGDHHIDEFGIQESSQRLRVAYNDKNDDDQFMYAVDYTWVPVNLVVSSGVRTGTARGGARVTLPPFGQKVLAGFRFDFLSQDHHLRDVGVFQTGNNIDVFFGDFNQDDEFRWEVKWLTLRP